MNPKKFRGACSNGCGNEIKRTGKEYCSVRCARSIRPRKSCPPCLNGCGKRVKLHKNEYCSFSCMHEYRYACKAEAFFMQGGVRGHVAQHFLARLLRDYYGERCLRCSWSRRHLQTGKVPVEVEHIDGNWENNRLTNLTLLCPNCHALTPTFRGLNRGRGRAHRLGGRGNPIKI